ncbi:MAG: hypothetical protein ACREUK_04845 [Burkholderiales bacterium]
MRVIAICSALSLFVSSAAIAAGVLGTKPSQLTRSLSSVENEQAMSRLIWAPGLDDGYVPQGVAWVGGALYLSAYLSPTVGTKHCRLYKLDPASGDTLGRLDLPEGCGHAGGLAYAGKGILIISDTRRLYRIDLAAAFPPGKPSRTVTADVTLRGALKGSFIDFDGSDMFVGSYEKEPGKARGYFVPLSVFDKYNGESVDESAALRSVALPQRAQGAGFDKAGRLWIAASSSQFGRVYRLDPKTGHIEASFEMPVGIEDIGFDDGGQFWSVSEAGSVRWQEWRESFPVLFRVDPGKLK